MVLYHKRQPTQLCPASCSRLSSFLAARDVLLTARSGDRLLYCRLIILTKRFVQKVYLSRGVPDCKPVKHERFWVECFFLYRQNWKLSYSENVSRKCHGRHAAPEDRRAPRMWYYIQSLDRRAERLSGPALPYIHRHKQGGLGVLC